MRGWLAAQAEVLRSGHKAIAEQMLPESIDQDTGHQGRCAGIPLCEPLREGQAPPARTWRRRRRNGDGPAGIRQGLNDPRLDLAAGRLVVAALQEKGWRRRPDIEQRLNLAPGAPLLRQLR